MPPLPRFIRFLVQRAKVLVGCDLLGMLFADRRVAGSALFVLHFPVAEQVGGAATGAVSFPASHPADDSNVTVGEFQMFAHSGLQCSSPNFEFAGSLPTIGRNDGQRLGFNF